jgi:penicillin amidase
MSWIVRLIREKPRGWFANGRDAEIAAAFRSVCSELSATHGPDPKRWKWGELRKLEFKHPLGKLRALRRVFNHGPFAWGGDTNTIGQATNAGLDPCGNPGATPSLRVVVDVGQWKNSRFVLPGGQSGNPASRHYDDLLGLWKRGEGVPIAWDPEAVRAAAVESLELLPG